MGINTNTPYKSMNTNHLLVFGYNKSDHFYELFYHAVRDRKDGSLKYPLKACGVSTYQLPEPVNIILSSKGSTKDGQKEELELDHPSEPWIQERMLVRLNLSR